MDRTPSIVRRALLPMPLRIGDKVRLLPVTIGHALLLHELCSPFVLAKSKAAIANGEIFRAIFILAHPGAVTEALLAGDVGALDDAVAKFSIDLPEIPDAAFAAVVRHHINAAFESFAKTEFPQREGATIHITGPDGNGLGVMLNLVGHLIEMGHEPDLARLKNIPVITAFALSISNSIRAGAEWDDPSYAQIDRIDEEDAAAAAAPQKPAAPPGKRGRKGKR